MAYDGSGNYNRPVSDYVFDTVISETDMNTEMAGIATGLSTAITKNGQTTVTANLPMAGFRHTGVGNAAATTDYAAAGQVQNSNFMTLASVAGTDTVTASTTPTLTAYVAGQTFRGIAASTITGAMTLNIDGLGAKAVEKRQAAMAANDIIAGDAFEVQYDGTQFQMLSPIRTEPLAGADGTILTGTAGTDGNLASWNADGDLVDGPDVLDEDNMASDSAADVATQQSIKAYVDSLTTSHSDSAATTSGTTVDLTGIPATINRIRIGLSGVSQDAANQVLLLQLGDAGGFETSGYSGQLTQPVATAEDTANSTGFALTDVTNYDAASVYIGEVVLTHYGSNVWSAVCSGNNNGANILLWQGQGFKTLTGVLTQVRLTTVAGTAAFDAGTMYLLGD